MTAFTVFKVLIGLAMFAGMAGMLMAFALMLFGLILGLVPEPKAVPKIAVLGALIGILIISGAYAFRVGIFAPHLWN